MANSSPSQTEDDDTATNVKSTPSQSPSEPTRAQLKRQQGPRKQPPVSADDLVRNDLNVETKVEFTDHSLQQALSEVLEKSRVKFSISNQAFLDASVDISQAISLNAQGSTVELLSRICQRYQASYIVSGTSIEVVPIEIASLKPATRFYDLAFVQPDSKFTIEIVSVIQQLIERSNWTLRAAISTLLADRR